MTKLLSRKAARITREIYEGLRYNYTNIRLCPAAFNGHFNYKLLVETRRGVKKWMSNCIIHLHT